MILGKIGLDSGIFSPDLRFPQSNEEEVDPSALSISLHFSGIIGESIIVEILRDSAALYKTFPANSLSSLNSIFLFDLANKSTA